MKTASLSQMLIKLWFCLQILAPLDYTRTLYRDGCESYKFVAIILIGLVY